MVECGWAWPKVSPLCCVHRKGALNILYAFGAAGSARKCFRVQCVSLLSASLRGACFRAIPRQYRQVVVLSTTAPNQAWLTTFMTLVHWFSLAILAVYVAAGYGAISIFTRAKRQMSDDTTEVNKTKKTPSENVDRSVWTVRL